MNVELVFDIIMVFLIYAEIAQLVEHLSEEQRVPSPNLGLGTFARVVQLARTTHCQCVGRGFDPRLSLQGFTIYITKISMYILYS